MRKNNSLNSNIIINLIYYLSVYIFSLFYLTTINHLHIIDIKGFSFSYLLGIFIIVFLSFLFTYKIYNIKDRKIKNPKENENENNKNNNNNNNNNNNKITLLFILLITLYIIIFINFIKYPLKLFNISTGIIASTIYSSKILLYSGTAIALNIFLENKKTIPSRKTIIITMLKFLLFISLGLLFLRLYKYKGLLYTISTLEIVHLIINLLQIKLN